jgi:hypothetical protein
MTGRRKDSLGFWWEDIPLSKTKKKREPPEPVWLEKDYLPHYEDAVKFDIPLMSDEEIVANAGRESELVFDIESYPNYFLIAFKHLATGKYFYLESSVELGVTYNPQKLRWILENYLLISFNGKKYDVPVARLSLITDNSSTKLLRLDRLN